MKKGKGQILLDIDELHKFIWNAIKSQSPYRPILLEAARLARKRGISISYKDQIYSEIPKDLVASCNTKVFFRIQDQDDLRKAERELNLSSEQTPALAGFDDQECAHTDKDMKEVLFSKVEGVDLSDLLTHEEIKALMEPKLEALSWKPAVEPGFQSGEKTFHADASEKEKLQLVLKAVAENQGEPLKVARVQTGLNPGQFSRILRDAEDMGLVARPEKISLGKAGSPALYTELLQPGAEFLGLDWEETRFKGGKNKTLTAKVMVRLVAEHFRRIGSSPTLEYMGADIAVINRDKVVCYECETTPVAHIARNVRRDLSREISADAVVVIMERAEDLERSKEICRTALTSREMELTHFMQVKNFLQ